MDPEAKHGKHFNPNLRSFDTLAEYPCLALLGEPGIGKTSAMQAEKNSIDTHIEAEGGETLWLDLRVCGDRYTLDQELFKSDKYTRWLGGNHRLHVFLDSLDECRLQITNVTSVLGAKLKSLGDAQVQRLSLRIGCRTAEWPPTLSSVMTSVWSKESVGIFELAPLRRKDVVTACVEEGVDPESFIRDVREAEATPLALKPVTLQFLLDVYAQRGEFPSRQVDLYLEGCRLLCEETNRERLDNIGRVSTLSADQKLAVSARIAAVTVYSNKFAVWTGLANGDLEDGDVPIRHLSGGTESVGDDEFVVGEDEIRETLATGLFSARGQEQLGWAHQTYAEFLAARYLVQRRVGVEQMMSLISHPDDERGRLIPQLHEASAWLANMSPEVFRKITEVDPEVLLRSDIASADTKDKAAVVETLLRLYDEEKLRDVGYAPHDRYRRLNHPGLAEQLRPYIADSGKRLVVRRVAIDIAEACELQELQEDAAVIAIDPEQEIHVRKEAAHFVARVGDSQTRRLLKPLAMGEAGDDPDKELRGNGLRAVWPEHITAEEMFDTLEIPDSSYFGAYWVFITREVSEGLEPEHLPAALDWVERQNRRVHMSFGPGELMDEVMLKAWDYLEVLEIRVAFARASLSLLREHDELVRGRNIDFADEVRTNFRQRIVDEDEKRRSLIDQMVEVLENTEDDALTLVHSGTPIVLEKDLSWLIGRLETAPSERHEAVYAAFIQRAFNPWNDEQATLVYEACSRNPSLAERVGHYFEPIDLSSEYAEQRRQYHREDEERRARREERSLPDPPIKERILRCLNEFETGDTDAFWELNYHMMFDDEGFSKVTEFDWDLTDHPGWQAANDTTRARILEAAERYLHEGDPVTEDWLGKESQHRPALAGYRALRLMQVRRPEVLNDLIPEVWEKWTPTILDYPGLGSQEEALHLDLVAEAYRASPDKVIETTLLLIDADGGSRDYQFVTRNLKKCWDDRVAEALLEKAKDEHLEPYFLEMLLDGLLNYGSDEAEELARSIVVSDHGDEERGERALIAARTLIFQTEDSCWSFLWPIMQSDTDFARKVIESIAHDSRHSGLPQARLYEEKVAALYIWVVHQYPPSEYFQARGGGSIGLKESLGMWREDLLRHLQTRGTTQAVREIQRIASELPEQEESLKWTLYAAEDETRRKTWSAPKLLDVLTLTSGKAKRLIQSGDQLLDVLIESLNRLEERLQGVTPLAFALWSEWNGEYRPNGEEWLSDFVKQHLEQYLSHERGILVNREVVIRKGEGQGRGERTDLLVEAVVAESDQYAAISAIIETKGCWNSELNTAMKNQLIDRYLAENDKCKHGLYLVGWFYCEQWDDTDSRKQRTPKYHLEVAREKFASQARNLSDESVSVRSVVLDTSLR